MKLIIGLGNPGLRYRNTRHNIGFLATKAVSRKFNIPFRKKRYRGVLAEGSIKGEKVTLFLPQTYMNLSGDAVRDIVKNEKIKPGNFLVICDDLDLPFGSMRLRTQGASGGHNGLQSLIKCLGTNEFTRLKIGIGQAERPKDAAKFVLEGFYPAERPILKDIIKEATTCALIWLKEGPDKAATEFNRRQIT
ncbi:aminoacyl-tRNA hydrolase [Candidatus Omnitrophota bacterium]